jgi:hypothetical protein
MAVLESRPRTLDAVARGRRSGLSFERLLGEFLDEFYVAGRAQRQAAIDPEPTRISAVHDAYLAVVAEHLALRFELHIPDWTETEGRVLADPFFAGGLEGLKALLLVESPLAFRRRQIFVSRDALSRPRDPERAHVGSDGD